MQLTASQLRITSQNNLQISTQRIQIFFYKLVAPAHLISFVTSLEIL